MIKHIFHIGLLFFCSICFAQKPNFPLENKPFFAKPLPLLFVNKTNFAAPVYASAKINPQTKLPAFCQMEVNLHKRFNVWMVFRAGNDEDYKKLIRQNNP
ncbi:MAG: hypothetical protein SFY56_09100 [Bacteroidota bacterium]|nr:hypothetical protein [Bacteroidota bacterium]